MQIANITKETPDPLNGKIEHWPGTKEPSGTLRENAMDLVRQHLPAYSDEDRQQALIKAIELANSRNYYRGIIINRVSNFFSAISITSVFSQLFCI